MAPTIDPFLPYQTSPTSMLELIHGGTQLIGALFCLIGALINLSMASGLLRVSSLKTACDKHGSTSKPALLAGVSAHRKGMLRNLLIGVGLLVVTNGLFQLSLNSFHIHAANHPEPLLNALTCMQVVLMLFVANMYTGYASKAKAADQLSQLSSSKQQHWNKIFSSQFEYLQAVDGLELSWSGDAEECVKTNIALLAAGAASKITATQVNHRAAYLRSESRWAFIYFFLNVIVFFGFNIGVLQWWFRGPSNAVLKVLRFEFLGIENIHTWGEIAGDTAWAIEPTLKLFVQPACAPKPKMKSE